MLSTSRLMIRGQKLHLKRRGSFKIGLCSRIRLDALPTYRIADVDMSAWFQRLDAASRSRIRSFGHVQLCGALHACWQTKDGVKGNYMVCLLYRGWLCLASASKTDQIYTIQACLALTTVNVEDVDNGRGMCGIVDWMCFFHRMVP